MPLDVHVRTVAWLHIVLGSLVACMVVIFGVVFGQFGAAALSQSAPPGLMGWIIGLFTLFIGYFLAYLALAILGGVLLLRGKPVGRVLTIIFSVLSLLNVPVGTALAVYSLWALLRTVPAASIPAPANVAHTS